MQRPKGADRLAGRDSRTTASKGGGGETKNKPARVKNTEF